MNAIEKLFKEKVVCMPPYDDRILSEKDVRTALLEFADDLVKRRSKYIKEINLIGVRDTEMKCDMYSQLIGSQNECGKIASEIRKAVSK